MEKFEVGDKVEVLIDVREDKTGQLVLSHRKARTIKSWDRVIAANETGEIVQGFVKCRTKGGMIVDVFGIEAFLPGSQIDVKPIRDYDVYVNKMMEFKVVKINHEFKNVVVSHKALIEADIEIQKKEIIGQLQKGQVLEGVVKNITSYGVFIDLGGVDGLIHITDLSWSRINHPSEVLELDQKLNVVILDFDDEKTRIQLGLKQLNAHPWDALDANLAVGDKVKGKVVVIADYGAFIEVAEGVEGLIHVSEMSWSTHLRSAQDFVKVGDEVEAVVLTLDREEPNIYVQTEVNQKDIYWNLQTPIRVEVADKSKLKSFETILIADQKEYVLENELVNEDPNSGILTFEIKPFKATDGFKATNAILRVKAKDSSSWNFFDGNEAIKDRFTKEKTPLKEIKFFKQKVKYILYRYFYFK